MQRTDGCVSPLPRAETNGAFEFLDSERVFARNGSIAPARFKGVVENLVWSPAFSRFGRVPA
jgi:hypothetical protein